MLEQAAAYARERARRCPVRRTSVIFLVIFMALQHVRDDEPDRVLADAEEQRRHCAGQDTREIEQYRCSSPLSKECSGLDQSILDAKLIINEPKITKQLRRMC